ncbi:retrovirus-related Pol polyprotein from transposon 412 [Trichonephila clavipes]|nr:retrovirus-related Pol polyprotein from transposon 412 [Trichonephila clavipes]
MHCCESPSALDEHHPADKCQLGDLIAYVEQFSLKSRPRNFVPSKVIESRLEMCGGFCVYYRRLNDVTKMNSYPLPERDDTLDTLAGNIWFSTLGLKSGYWQVELHPDDKEKTAFTTEQGLCNLKL